MTGRYCKRCNESLDGMFLQALLAGVGAKLSFNPAECYNPDTGQMEEHDLVFPARVDSQEEKAMPNDPETDA